MSEKVRAKLDIGAFMHGMSQCTIGKIMIILDAAGMEECQGNAVKDLVRQELWGRHNKMCRRFCEEGLMETE